MKPLVSSGISYHQDTLQTSKIYNIINIDNNQYGKNYSNHIFAMSAIPM